VELNYAARNLLLGFVLYIGIPALICFLCLYGYFLGGEGIRAFLSPSSLAIPLFIQRELGFVEILQTLALMACVFFLCRICAQERGARIPLAAFGALLVVVLFEEVDYGYVYFFAVLGHEPWTRWSLHENQAVNHSIGGLAVNGLFLISIVAIPLSFFRAPSGIRRLIPSWAMVFSYWLYSKTFNLAHHYGLSRKYRSDHAAAPGSIDDSLREFSELAVYLMILAYLLDVYSGWTLKQPETSQS
jgi:hypothetical protein